MKMKGNFIVLKILFICTARSQSQTYYNAAPASTYAYVSTYTPPNSYSSYPTGTTAYTSSTPQQAYTYDYASSIQAGNPATFSYSSYPTGTSTYTSLTPQQTYSHEYAPSAQAGYPAIASYSSYPTGTSAYTSSSPHQAYTWEYPSSQQSGLTVASLPSRQIEGYGSLGSQLQSSYACIPYPDLSSLQKATPLTKEYQNYGLNALTPLPPYSYDTSPPLAPSLSTGTNPLQNYSPLLATNSFLGTANGNLQAASLMNLNNHPNTNTNFLNENTLANGLLFGLNGPTVSEVSIPNTYLNDLQNVAVSSQALALNTKPIGTEIQGNNKISPAVIRKFKAAKIKALDRHIQKTVSRYVEDAIKKAGSHDQLDDKTGQSAMLASTNESDYIDFIPENLSGQSTRHVEKGTQKITVDHSSNTNPGHLSVTLSGASAKNIDIKVHNQDQQALTQNPTECNPQFCKTILEKESSHDNQINSEQHWQSNENSSETQHVITDPRESLKESTKTVNVLVYNKKENNIGNTLSNDSSNKVSKESQINEIINNIDKNTVVANNTLVASTDDIDVINESNSSNVTNQENKTINTVTTNEENKNIDKRFIDEDPLDETATY